jgi:hypothetical protein
MTLNRIQVELQGGPGGNGVVTLYGLEAAGLKSAADEFITSWHNLMPNDVIVSSPNTGDVINEETGELTGTWTSGSVVGFTGTDTGTWVAGVGARINWLTAGIVAGRRVQGRTFVVPLGSGAFGTGGLPLTTTIDYLGAWATNLLDEVPGNLQIWSRPSGARAGSKHTITSAFIPVEGTMLRSRRT